MTNQATSENTYLSYPPRILLAVALVAAGCVAHTLLRWHVVSPGPLPAVALRLPLEELPRQLGDWLGRDRPVADSDLLFADQHLQRAYVHHQTGQTILVWLVYSNRGEDRSHHPEVCMAVAGQQEDRGARQTLNVAGHAAPVQQYRFGRDGAYQWVYYWYYTLLPEQPAQLSSVQRLFRRLHYRPSSLTVEVFAPERNEHEVEAAQSFVRRIDQALQPLLGATAVRGSHRKPVTRIEVAK